MNYLAHAFLSFSDPQIQVGNMMGDFIKGKRYHEFPERIQTGILLHRKIDNFTDNHPLIHEAKHFFRPAYRFSGGVFTDILFDHFLASDTNHFVEESLQQFTTDVYKNLNAHQHLFSEKIQTLFAHMQRHNWLFHYRTNEGLTQSIQGMCRRFPVLGQSEAALEIIQRRYPELQALYLHFFPALTQFVNQQQVLKLSLPQ